MHFHRLKTKVLDLLAGDARLILGGEAWAAGWPAALRMKDGVAPAAGSVNIFDTAYLFDTSDARPAIYVGGAGQRGKTAIDWPAVNSNGQRYHRTRLPLVLCVEAANPYDAECQVDQLHANIARVLRDYPVVDGYWYLLDLYGDAIDRDDADVRTVGASGGAAQGIATATTIVVVNIHHSSSRTGVYA